MEMGLQCARKADDVGGLVRWGDGSGANATNDIATSGAKQGVIYSYRFWNSVC
jgi:hypothetical protein